MPIDVLTNAGASTPVSDEALEALRGQIRGDVLTGDDAAQVRASFNAMHPGVPAVTVQCNGTADVADAVNFAREHGLLVAVRGGGHSIAGLSAGAGALLIDLERMNAVQVDPGNRVAYVQGGAVLGDVDRETQAFGLVTPLGVASETGVGGLTLGGGYGWVRRKYGLSCDNIESAQVVCADGEVRTASAGVNPDLFWAIRGGGGNFGIVTSFTFRLHPLGPIVPFVGAWYALEDAGHILRGWRDYLETVPDEITSAAVSITFPADPAMPEVVHDRECLIIGALWSGPDIEEGMRELHPLRELGTPLIDVSQPMSFTAVQTGFDPLFPRGELQAYWKSTYLDELSDAAIDLIATKQQQRPAPITMINVFHMGGAIAHTGPEDTAFSERTPPFMVSIDGIWSDPADNAERIAWVRSTWQEIAKFGNGGVYLNFTGLAEEEPSAGVDTAFGRNLRRLGQIKQTYDPGNFFRLNNNVAPVSD
jgi:FAD/FMN-containing dehydrogenase